MAKKRDFTLQRGGEFERTMVGRDGHFTDEGRYQRAIANALSENNQSSRWADRRKHQRGVAGC